MEWVWKAAGRGGPRGTLCLDPGANAVWTMEDGDVGLERRLRYASDGVIWMARMARMMRMMRCFRWRDGCCLAGRCEDDDRCQCRVSCRLT